MTPAVDSYAMAAMDSRRISSAPRDQSRLSRPFVYTGVILAAFVVAVVMTGVEDGPSAAAVTALLALALAGTVVGVWGTAMAVRETEELGAQPDD